MFTEHYYLDVYRAGSLFLTSAKSIMHLPAEIWTGILSSNEYVFDSSSFSEKFEKSPPQHKSDLLMNTVGRGHVIETAIDQLNPAFIGESKVFFNRMKRFL